MALREEFEDAGNWLFRWRSYLPLLLIGLFLLALRNYHYPFGSHKLEQVWEIFCLLVSFLGLGIRILTIGFTPRGTSGRNTREQVAEVLNVTGMYSLMRHPLYVGNFFIYLGLSFYLRLWWFSLICILLFWIYYERIMFAEESFLRKKFAEAYSRWAMKTPTVIPRFKNWQSPGLPFSFRTVLRREYSSFFGVIAAFTALEITSNWFIERKLEIDRLWGAIFLTGLIFYLVLRFLKKKTKLLDVEGR